MEAIDTFFNRYISPASVPAGVGTVFLTFFSGKLAPQMPDQFYKLLDNLVVRIVVISFLINQQIKSPSKAIIIATVGVVAARLFVNVAAPDAPSLSEIVHPSSASKEKEKGNGGSNPCSCHVTVNLQQSPETLPTHIQSISSGTPTVQASGHGMGWLSPQEAAAFSGTG